MGLDMYFASKCNSCDSTSEVGYWRKANAIHKWFVDNVQGGVDNCDAYPVTRENIEKLLSTVNEVLTDNETAVTLLPTASGFFFGDTSYGSDYIEYLTHTKDVMEKALATLDKTPTVEFFYQSSW